MEQAILIVHVLAALTIIGLILMQQGKGAEMGASFGAGASQTLFGSQGGGNVLTKATALAATVFFVTSFGLAVVAKNSAQQAGDVGIPQPQMIESKSSSLAPEGAGSEIPQLDAAGAMEIPAVDVPSGAPVSDIPGVE